MRLNIQLLLLLCIISVITHAQKAPSSLLNIGDLAPPLRVRGWVKGEPVKRFEKGHVYVLEFWATWCGPCIASMPHLSALAGIYKDRVSILGIDVYEKKTTSLEKVKAFVDSMGNRMNFQVAAEDSNFMATGWLEASEEYSIPTSFVVNGEGRVAWIGYPKALDDVLPKIVNNTWDIQDALVKRNLDKRLEKLDRQVTDKLISYLGDQTQDDPWKPDSALWVINEMVRNEPNLKYAPVIAFYTFSNLIKTNVHKAYEYGKVAIATPTYEPPACYAIIDAIVIYSDKLNLPPEIYQLGAEAYQERINQIPYPEIVDLPRLYTSMAAWYWRANDESKAIDALQKAIDAQKSKHAREMAALESQLEQYKKTRKM